MPLTQVCNERVRTCPGRTARRMVNAGPDLATLLEMPLWTRVSARPWGEGRERSSVRKRKGDPPKPPLPGGLAGLDVAELRARAGGLRTGVLSSWCKPLDKLVGEGVVEIAFAQIVLKCEPCDQPDGLWN